MKDRLLISRQLRFLSLSLRPIGQILIVIGSSLVILTISPVSKTIMANTMVLNATELNQKIQELPDWKIKDNTLTKTFEFKDFVTAIDFVNQLVEPAESAGHHPDLAISYNKVSVSLTTHDAGGITQKDFDLAREISQLNP